MHALYAFIGGGNMGRALIGGLVASGHPAASIRVADPVEETRDTCTREFNVATFADNASACSDADVVVLAVKPQQMREVATALAAHASDHALYISIAAGITSAHLETWLGQTRAIVRCMPNTPALIGAGAAAMFANAHVDAAQRSRASDLLGAVGSAVWVEDEALMDAVTAVSGSGPAYFFRLIELIEKVALELGLPAASARELTLQTAVGAAQLAAASAHSPAELREQVTSPGGTTERALKSFSDAGLEDIVRHALTAARDRSIELAQQADA